MGNHYPSIQKKLRQIEEVLEITHEQASKMSGISLGTYNAAVCNGTMGRKTKRKIEKWIKSKQHLLLED